MLGCVGWCRAAVRGSHDLFGGVGCTVKIFMRRGVVDRGSSEKCISGVVGSLRNLS